MNLVLVFLYGCVLGAITLLAMFFGLCEAGVLTLTWRPRVMTSGSIPLSYVNCMNCGKMVNLLTDGLCLACVSKARERHDGGCVDCHKTSKELEPGNFMHVPTKSGKVVCDFCLERRR
jgi:hypothetical protein